MATDDGAIDLGPAQRTRTATVTPTMTATDAAVAALRHPSTTWPRSRPSRWRPAACPRPPTRCSHRAATRWPDRTAITVLPEAARWREPLRRTFAELLADVHRYANLLHGLGVRRGDAVALMAPNCAELDHRAPSPRSWPGSPPRSTAPCPGDTSPSCCSRSGARVLVTAGPQLAPPTWQTALELAGDGLLDAILVLRPTGGGGRTAAAAAPSTGCTSVTWPSWPPAWTRPDSPATRQAQPTWPALFHTGGTTGAPKLAAHTHANEVADAWMLAANGCSTPTRRCSPRCRCSTSTPWSSPCWRRCSRASRWCGPGRWATATPRCSASSGRSSSTTGSRR